MYSTHYIPSIGLSLSLSTESTEWHDTSFIVPPRSDTDTLTLSHSHTVVMYNMYNMWLYIYDVLYAGGTNLAANLAVWQGEFAVRVVPA